MNYYGDYSLLDISRADAEICAYLLRVEVFVDNALNNSLSVVVKESRASLSKSRNQLVQGLERNRIENSNQAAKQPFKSYQANLIEEVHDLLFSCLVRDKLILNYIIIKYEQAIVFTYIGYNVHTNVAGQLITMPSGSQLATTSPLVEDAVRIQSVSIMS